MNLAVFGATGRTGRHVVEQALAGGHRVSALVRDEGKLPTKHERLRVVVGDALDGGKVEEALRGQGAAIVALGPVKGGPDDLLERASENIVRAAKATGVRRLIAEGGAGMRVEEDAPGFGSKLMSGLVGLMIPKQVHDKRRQMEIMRGSGLEWAVVRAPVLTDGPLTSTYRLGFPNLGPGAKISRADIAHAMLNLATMEDSPWLGQAPAIRY